MTARPRPRGGFTLVEVLMALTLLAVGLLALAGLGATALRTVHGGSTQTVAAAVAQSRFDSLASVPCDSIAAAAGSAVVSGTASTRGIVERWSAQRVANGNMVRVTNALRVPGRRREYRYLGMRACR